MDNQRVSNKKTDITLTESDGDQQIVSIKQKESSKDSKDTETSPFDRIRHEDEQGEYWLARELQTVLGYDTWRRFEDTIKRAMQACHNVEGENGVSTRFVGFGKSAMFGTVKREQQEYRLDRYACYLVAMNGDPSKSEIAAAQTYFAIRTRQAELQLKPMTPLEILKQQVVIMENHEKRLASLENKVIQLRDKDNGIILRQQKINIDHQEQLDRHEADITELKTVMSDKGPAESVKVLISDIVRITAETENPYSYQDAYKIFYDQLRRDHKINIAARVTTLKKRKVDEGWTNTKIRQISGLDAITADPLIWDKVRQTVDYIRQCLTEVFNS